VSMLIHIILIAVITTILSVLIKQYKSEVALCISIAGGIVILLMIAPLMRDTLSQLNTFTAADGIENDYIKTIIRVISVSYITELGASIARDAGEGTLAMKVELGGKLTIFSICIPILLNLINIVTGMIA